MRFDIVLMDVRMPGINGIDCTRMLREAGISIPIFFLSADIGIGTQYGVLPEHSGAISKPITMTKMAQLLKTHFGISSPSLLPRSTGGGRGRRRLRRSQTLRSQRSAPI
jgi:CheY-like chemotaxis protein